MLPAIAAVGAGSLGLLLAGPIAAAVSATVAGVTMSRLRIGQPVTRPDSRALALLLDLIASVLGSGAPPDHALALVSEAVEETGQPELVHAVAPLRRVGRLLALGAEPELAWTGLAENPGYEAVSRAGRRCADTGARMSGAFRDLAVELRADRHTAALASAERVGVWSLLPLGFCFLPAFICIGIIPVVIGVAGEVLGNGAAGASGGAVRITP
jgi:pilus assembly protein TadC